MTKHRVAIDIGGTFTDLVALNEKSGKILNKALPKTYVSLSSEIAPEYREYERASTAVVNAVLMPIVSNYLDDLQRKIRKLKVKAPLCIMQSDGGIATKTVVSKKTVSMVESGPAAGVIASAFYGKILGINNILSFDMGGTTAKAGATGEYYIIKPNGKRVKLKSKCTIEIEKDDVFVVRTPGGGGYGNPLEREPKLVLDDVLNGLVRLEAAKEDYGVAIDSVTMKIDWKSTEQLRVKK